MIKTSALGDVIQCFLALDFLHQNIPNVQIDWVIEKSFAPLLTAHPYVNRVFEINTKKWKKKLCCIQTWQEMRKAIIDLRRNVYDCTIDFQGNIKSGLLVFSIKSRDKIGFTWKTVPEWPNIFFTHRRFHVDLLQPMSQQYLALAAKIFPEKRMKGSLYIQLKVSQEEEKWIKSKIKPGCRMMVCMGSSWENKKLSWEVWRDFLRRIRDKFAPIFYFVWGNEKEQQEAKEMSQIFKGSIFLPRISLPVWQRLMDQMVLVFTVDSSALHLAATTKTWTYSFFGPSSHQIYKPIGNHHGFYQGSCPYHQSFIKRCSQLRTCESGACLKHVSVDILFRNFCNWFSHQKSCLQKGS